MSKRNDQFERQQMSERMPDRILAVIANDEPITIDEVLAAGAEIDTLGKTNPSTVLLCAAYAGRTELIRELSRAELSSIVQTRKASRH